MKNGELPRRRKRPKKRKRRRNRWKKLVALSS
jgi:hypothetical protein